MTLNPCLSFASETKLAMTEQEEGAWRERISSSLAASSSTGGTDSGTLDGTSSGTLGSPRLPSGTLGSPRLPATGAAGTPDYHFICECFFLTARALHLGVCKLVNDSQHHGREIQQLQAAMAELQGEETR